MLHVRVSQSLNFQFGAFTVLVFHTVVVLAVIHSCRGQSEVIGPSQPIVAIVGEDIILPCYLDPVMNAFDLTVEWARPDLDPRFVLVWRDGVELESKKHPSYKGRTSLFTDELKHGNVSLKLSKVKISDEGRYRCFFPELVRDSTVQLVVGAVSSPVIQTTKNSSGVVLQCESKGWYPEPEVFWLDGEGNLLSAGPTETVTGPDDLYTVSSRVTVEKRHSNNFTCRVQQKNINQTRETHIHVLYHFFMVPSTPGTPGTPGTPSSQHVIIGSIIGCAALVSIPALVFVVWKWRQNKIRNKKHHEDEETQKVREKKSNSTSNNSEQESLMERETDREQLTAERETLNDLDKEKEKLVKKLKTKEREQGKFEEKVSRFEGQMKDKEEQIKQLQLQLEEVERQREETERKLQSVNREEDKMDPETQKEAAGKEKDEAVRLLLDTMKDLERKKAELQKQLEKREKLLEGKKREEIIMTERKMKATNEKEETIKRLKEVRQQSLTLSREKAENQSDSDEDL